VVREFINPQVSHSGLASSPSGADRWRHAGSTCGGMGWATCRR
jgi:hypothetical protein